MKLTDLSDVQLAADFRDLVIDEQERLALQLLHLAEIDRRKLFFEHDSLRAFLVAECGMEEHVAERRIRAARLAKRLPDLLKMIETGRLNLTLIEIALGCAHREKLADPELTELLEAMSGLSCRAAKREIARRYPQTTELPYDRIRPITGELSEVRFVATEELLEKLAEIRGLLAHSHPGINLCGLIDHLATDYRERHHPAEKARRAKERADKREAELGREESEALQSDTIAASAQPKKPTSNPPTAPLLDANNQAILPATLERRTFPAAVVHEIINRDEYRCSFVDPITRKRCSSNYGLEKDHVKAWAVGGNSELENCRILCTSHHSRISFLQFGEEAQYFKGPSK